MPGCDTLDGCLGNTLETNRPLKKGYFEKPTSSQSENTTAKSWFIPGIRADLYGLVPVFRENRGKILTLAYW